jgi:hypothetical protein
MYKICIDDDLKDVAGGLHTPFENGEINESEKNTVKRDDKTTTDEKN